MITGIPNIECSDLYLGELVLINGEVPSGEVTFRQLRGDEYYKKFPSDKLAAIVAIDADGYHLASNNTVFTVQEINMTVNKLLAELTALAVPDELLFPIYSWYRQEECPHTNLRAIYGSEYWIATCKLCDKKFTSSEVELVVKPTAT